MEEKQAFQRTSDLEAAFQTIKDAEECRLFGWGAMWVYYKETFLQSVCL
jgi:hypothetical protein